MNRRFFLGAAGAAALAPVFNLWKPTPRDIVVAAEGDVPSTAVAATREPDPPEIGIGWALLSEDGRVIGAITEMALDLGLDIAHLPPWARESPIPFDSSASLQINATLLSATLRPRHNQSIIISKEHRFYRGRGPGRVVFR